MNYFVDRIHRLPRIWSNRELKKFAHLFKGDIVNVSAWKDIDKEGQHYRDYFSNASSYTITNYEAESRGFQGYENEHFLDLEDALPENLYRRFDVVFNHTTLEHIFHVNTAFKNLCDMSHDIVILILPFLQQYHSTYGDYWRFTPLAIKQLFATNDYSLLYQSFNSHKQASIYTFSIASRQPEKWQELFDFTFTVQDPLGKGHEPYVGYHAIPNSRHRVRSLIKRLTKL
ncbi:MAG: hypothetical protein GY943_37720 [Chloroflexi bacterium]|nr:hypothetical protein [Chloroflexota bacterium]